VDSSVKQHNEDDGGFGVGSHAAYKPLQSTVPSNSAAIPKHSKYMKEHKDKKAIAHYSPDTHKISKKPKPSHLNLIVFVMIINIDYKKIYLRGCYNLVNIFVICCD